MNSLLNTSLVLVLLLNFFALGSSRLAAIIRAAAVQGVVLGLLPLLVHGSFSAHTIIVAAAAMLLKGMVIPSMLFRAIRDADMRRELAPLIGWMPSLFLGAVGTALALAFARYLPLLPGDAGSLLVPASLATLLTGFLLVTTRLKAVTQVVGYLVLENGVFIFGLLLLEAMPFFVEMGVLLDLFVGIFVMGIIINHINREFSSIDTEQLTALKD